MTTTRKNESLRKTGECAMDSIREMVDALECDYDRLEELRDDRDSFDPDDYMDEDDEDADEPTWEGEFPDEAGELEEWEAMAGDCEDQDDARQRIEEDPLSIEIGGWWEPGSKPEATEYRILLSTGGPATRIVGDLDEYNEPTIARLEVQDWGTPWTEHVVSSEDDEKLLTYARCFYYGD